MKSTQIVAGAAAVSCLAMAASGPAFGSLKTQDSKAKSNARNLTSMIETCYTDTMDYSRCRTASQLRNAWMGPVDVPIGSKPGQARVSQASKQGYTIDAYSKSGNHFLMVKSPSGIPTRKCTKAGRAGCRTGGVW